MKKKEAKKKREKKKKEFQIVVATIYLVKLHCCSGLYSV